MPNESALPSFMSCNDEIINSSFEFVQQSRGVEDSSENDADSDSLESESQSEAHYSPFEDDIEAIKAIDSAEDKFPDECLKIVRQIKNYPLQFHDEITKFSTPIVTMFENLKKMPKEVYLCQENRMLVLKCIYDELFHHMNKLIAVYERAVSFRCLHEDITHLQYPYQTLYKMNEARVKLLERKTQYLRITMMNGYYD
jgi:hypothetical protein